LDTESPTHGALRDYPRRNHQDEFS
jgi:hypothetical protein